MNRHDMYRTACHSLAFTGSKVAQLLRSFTRCPLVGLSVSQTPPSPARQLGTFRTGGAHSGTAYGLSTTSHVADSTVTDRNCADDSAHRLPLSGWLSEAASSWSEPLGLTGMWIKGRSQVLAEIACDPARARSLNPLTSLFVLSAAQG